MATETTNIDDILMSGKTDTQPAAPEYQPEIEDEGKTEEGEESPGYEPQSYDENKEEQEEEESSSETDDYGNTKPKAKTYTEDEVHERINKAVRERMARFERNNPTQQQALPQQVQQQVAQDYTYNPDGEGNWQQQLESFVEQTFTKINQRQVSEAQQQREARVQAEFQDKFTQGMEKFSDFRQVVEHQPITDPMTIALRGLKDPASFIYAASKRHPEELQRISQIPDNVAQMVEMGKLEERMRKNATGTKAPRPLSRTKEDTGLPYKDKKNSDPSIEELIARADAKKRAMLVQKRGR